MCKTLQINGINYQPQLVSRISSINSMDVFVWKTLPSFRQQLETSCGWKTIIEILGFLNLADMYVFWFKRITQWFQVSRSDWKFQDLVFVKCQNLHDRKAPQKVAEVSGYLLVSGKSMLVKYKIL